MEGGPLSWFRGNSEQGIKELPFKCLLVGEFGCVLERFVTEFMEEPRLLTCRTPINI
jgi:hypothetical protein